jgi:hypothetical protein
MVHDIYYSRTHVWIRRIVLLTHGMDSNICWNSYSSRTYVQIIRMVLVSLCGVGDLFIIMPGYSNEVWIRDMMQLMLSDDIDSDYGAHEMACMDMMILLVEWYVCAQDHFLQYLPS